MRPVMGFAADELNIKQRIGIICRPKYCSKFARLIYTMYVNTVVSAEWSVDMFVYTALTEGSGKK